MSGFYSGKTVLVTGGAGAIGSNLVRSLLAMHARVVILDDLSASTRWNMPEHARLHFIHGDITDPTALGLAFAERPDLVFHLAAFFANQNSMENPEEDLRVNGLGTLRVLRASGDAGVDRVVYASSGCSIYGDRPERPLREELISTRLSTPYQVTKMLGELYANCFHEQADLPVVKARLFNSYGPWDPPGRYRNVIPNFIWRALHGQPLPITGSGDETRDFTFVQDIVAGLLLCASVEGIEGDEFNLASGREVRIADLARSINTAVGNEAGLHHLPRRRWDTKTRLLADITRARERLGYEPTWDLDRGLEQTLGWFRSRWDRLSTDPRFRPPTVDPGEGSGDRSA